MRNNELYIKLLIAKCLLACFLVSCSGYPNKVEEVLALSGSNRTELEKVLEYYRDSVQKREAAEFLITNMAGITVKDPAMKEKYAPFYQQCDSVRRLYKDKQGGRWINLVDTLWKNFKSKRDIRIYSVPLLQAVTSQQLITEIDLAFRTWKENVYSRDCPFEEFCEYILPFYRGSFVLDSSRVSFYDQYKGFFSHRNGTFDIQVDSLIYLQKNIVFSSFNNSNVPVISCEALMKIGGGACTDKGTFNALLFSALGMPVAVDFVPLWGNRSTKHSWNVLVLDGKHYVFDPFLGYKNGLYNRLYGNLGVREAYGQGEFRCPKVYRKTYSTHEESTLLGKDMPTEDIPPLFRNFKMMDVSAQYFESTDVDVELIEKMPDGAEYAYLCVYSSNGWLPVQFGKIRNGRVLFKDMGRNIVYLPAYYKQGRLEPAAVPILLKTDGKVIPLDGNGPEVDSLAVRNITLMTYTNNDYAKCLENASITVVGEDGKENTLCRISERLPAKRTVYNVHCNSGVRFLRMYLPTDSIALGELSFYTLEGQVRSPRILSTLQALSEEKEEAVFDRFTSTCFRAKVKGPTVDIDLGEECRLTSIVIVPYVLSQIFENDMYRLYCWKNNDWQLLGEQKGGNGGTLFFKNMPGNGLFRLDRRTEEGKEYDGRIFIYKDGELLLM